MKMRRLFTLLFTVLICAAVFFFISVFYLEYEIKAEQKETDKSQASEPYRALPTNSGILFTFDGKENCFIYLDFERKSCFATFTNSDSTRIGKYPVDYTVKSDWLLVAGIIDRLGGLEYDINGETRRFTGVQAAEFISQSGDNYETKAEAVRKIFDKISQNGFSKEDFVYIIKSTNTDLLVPDCFYWENYMSELAKNFEVIT